MLFHFFFSLCLGIVLNMMAAVQRIATEIASARAAAVAASTGNDAPAQQVFRLLAPRFVLLTGEAACRTLCSGHERICPRDEAITFLFESNPGLKAPLPIRELITGVTEMTRGNINGWVHVDMKKKQQAKVYALQTYIARANKSLLELFFNLWQACAWQFFDTDVCSEQRVKVYALQVYRYKIELEFFFNIWQACWANRFDAYMCSEP